MCKKKYNFFLKRRFRCDCAHLCSFGSLHNSFELASLLLVTIGVLFTVSVLDFEVRVSPEVDSLRPWDCGGSAVHQELRREAGSSGMIALLMLALACMLAVGFTVHTVFHRWKASTSDTDLVDHLSAV